MEKERILAAILIFTLLIPIVLSGCSDADSEETEIEKPDVVITIGNLTDKTGVASGPMSIIDTALNDVVEYYNDNNLIPGVTLKVIDFDEQYNPTRDIPGYESLIARGADFIWTPVPMAVPSLLERANSDEYVIFAATANMEESVLEGGYIFSLGVTPRHEAYTLLDWISNNHEDYPTNRIAKIGGAAWDDAYSQSWFFSAKDYIEAYPGRFVWEKEFLTAFKFDWSEEIQVLKDFDYVYLPVPPHVFIKDFRKAAGESSTLIGTEVQCAFMGVIEHNDLWDELDGSLFIRVTPWYHETGKMIDLINQILNEKHSPEDVQRFKKEGVGYLSAKQSYLMLDIVREAVEEVGPENFDSHALYNAANTWSYDMAGIEDFFSYDEKKRMSQNYYAVYEADGDNKTLNRISDWMYRVTDP